MFDQQSGWEEISVRARIVCVGSSDPISLVHQIASSAGLPLPDNIHVIALENGCDLPIKVAVDMVNLDGQKKSMVG
jgi:hypothetical protein